jgi:hypothetical protein
LLINQPENNLMKTRTLFILGALVTAFFSFTAFKKTTTDEFNLYNVALVNEGPEANGYQWTWTVTNPNPGSGTNGTIQNLSHWSIAVSNSIEIQNVLGVAYSLDGVTWHELTPSIAVDKSNPCSIGQTVLKFDYGTTGSQPTYYRLILDQPLETTTGNTVYFKSGTKTGCDVGAADGPSLVGTTR